MVKIVFTKSKITIEAPVGTELIELFRIYEGKIPLKFGCCHGTCGTCAIKVIEGENNLSPKTDQEIETLLRLHLKEERLACQCALKGNISIES